jgi:hypothetical protein
MVAGGCSLAPRPIAFLRFLIRIVLGGSLAESRFVGRLPFGRIQEGGPGLFDFLQQAGTRLGMGPVLVRDHPGRLFPRRFPDHLKVRFVRVEVEQKEVVDGPLVLGDSQPSLVGVEHDRSPGDVGPRTNAWLLGETSRLWPPPQESLFPGTPGSTLFLCIRPQGRFTGFEDHM